MYRVIVANEDQMVYTSPALEDFDAAKEVLVTELLNTAENDWSVKLEDMETLVPYAEGLDEEKYKTPFYLGQYIHLIVKDDENKLDN